MKPFVDFNQFNLPTPLVEALTRMEFKAPTPIQAAGIPPALLGKDILGIAPTGTGKTGAYGIPAIASLYPEPGKQILVLAPTRELAAQIYKFMRDLGEKLNLTGTLIVGGESFWRQCREIKKGVDFIVATPGRLNDHLNNGLPLGKVSTLILDEVDRMLDMGFAPQVEQIVMHIPRTRQTFLFSATMPREIQQLASRYLKEPVRITVEETPEQAAKITEEQIETTTTEKPRLLVDQVTARAGKILVFVNTQGHSEQVARNLENAGHPSVCLHGGRTHGERKRALDDFRQGTVRVLVATDIAARGIDVPDIAHVINYDRPNSHEDYLHRIGRTGRFGRTGCAVNLIDERSRRYRPRPQGGRFQSHSSGGPRRQSGGGGGFSKPRPFGNRPTIERRQPERFASSRNSAERRPVEGRSADRNPSERRSAAPSKRPGGSFFKKRTDLPKFIEKAGERIPKNSNPRGGARRRTEAAPFKQGPVAKHWAPRAANAPAVRGTGGTLRRAKKPGPTSEARS